MESSDNSLETRPWTEVFQASEGYKNSNEETGVPPKLEQSYQDKGQIADSPVGSEASADDTEVPVRENNWKW